MYILLNVDIIVIHTCTCTCSYYRDHFYYNAFYLFKTTVSSTSEATPSRPPLTSVLKDLGSVRLKTVGLERYYRYLQLVYSSNSEHDCNDLW